MANGGNEPIVFTRDDSERLIRIETKLDALNGIKDKVIRNTTAIRYIKWLVGSMCSGGLFLILRVVGVL